MTSSADGVETQTLSLPEELILILLNEEDGYFHQVPGWNLNCVVVGAALAELSLLGRIDTDLESLILVDKTDTHDIALDTLLDEIASETEQHSTTYWIERLAPLAETIIDDTLARLVRIGILQHHDGDFWTMAPTSRGVQFGGGEWRDTAAEFVRNRIIRVIFSNEIPEPRDIILICLVNTCDVFRFIFPIEEEDEKRIEQISRMDVIGRSIAEAVSQNLAGPLLRRSGLAKKIPTVPLRKLLFNKHLRSGNIPALFGELAERYGPVFQIKPPFMKPLVFLAGPATNRWAHRQGRMYLRTRDYFHDFEKEYGAAGVLPSLDGADHFRLRKSLQPAYSRTRLEGQLDMVYRNARAFMSNWKVGDALPASNTSRMMINAQVSPFFISVESQDLIADLAKYKERVLSVHVMNVMPKFMLKTPGMRRRAKLVDSLLERVQGVHTPAQRAGQPRDLADDYLSLHASDPQFVPESNLRFVLTVALVASVYLGDMMSFCLYAMATKPELHAEIRREADALFENGDPDGDDITPDSIHVTHRFIMECMRMWPIVPMSVRNVMNTCVVEGFELPVGTRVHVAQTAAHYMDDVFPDATTFDIDRYLPPRNEHHSPGYAPFGLGTHTCLGNRQMELQLTVNLLLIARHFTFDVSPAKFRENLKINSLPSLKPHEKLKLVVTERRGI